MNHVVSIVVPGCIQGTTLFTKVCWAIRLLGSYRQHFNVFLCCVCGLDAPVGCVAFHSRGLCAIRDASEPNANCTQHLHVADLDFWHRGPVCSSAHAEPPSTQRRIQSRPRRGRRREPAPPELYVSTCAPHQQPRPARIPLKWRSCPFFHATRGWSALVVSDLFFLVVNLNKSLLSSMYVCVRPHWSCVIGRAQMLSFVTIQTPFVVTSTAPTTAATTPARNSFEN